ncbi:YidB family protein [Pararhizobium sp. DWP3-4]|uniref:YidB family protein n=1 Tax=unclassified Pararhizobium TaxID=2643050 RepID=UPI003CFB03BE
MASNALKALLGVLAVAGYQNRDKITEILRGLRNPSQLGPDGQTQSGGLGDILGGLSGGSLGGLGDLFRGGASGGSLSGGLGDLLKQFEQKGQGETAKSWVEPGPNKDIDDSQLSEVLGPEILDDLAAKTGLSRDEILSRLSRDLPKAVDDMTPGGQLPADDVDDLNPTAMTSVPPIKPQMV